MSLTMREKQAVTRQLAVEYKRATKKEKGKILDTLTELTGYNRSYERQVGSTIVFRTETGTPLLM